MRHFVRVTFLRFAALAQKCQYIMTGIVVGQEQLTGGLVILVLVNSLAPGPWKSALVGGEGKEAHPDTIDPFAHRRPQRTLRACET